MNKYLIGIRNNFSYFVKRFRENTPVPDQDKLHSYLIVTARTKEIAKNLAKEQARKLAKEHLDKVSSVSVKKGGNNG